MRNTAQRGFPLLAWACLVLAGRPVWGQVDFGGLLKENAAGTDSQETIKLAASFTIAPDGRTGTLTIEAQIAEGWHTYSITQPSDGPIRTTIKLDTKGKLGTKGKLESLGDFKAVPEPTRHVDNQAFKGVTLEEHEGAVAWTAPFTLARGIDPATMKIGGKVNAQVCNAGGCLPPRDFSFTAALAAEFGEYAEDPHVTFRAHLEPRTVKPGGKARLVVTAEPNEDDGRHIYAVAERVPKTGNKPTLIVFTKTSGLIAAPPRADSQPTKGPDAALGYYEKPVTWITELSVPESAKPGPLALSGILGYQMCTESSCDRPTAVGFEGIVTVGSPAVGGSLPIRFSGKKSYQEAEKSLAGTAQQPAADEPLVAASGHASLWFTLGTALLGGLILNIMPCVLPVIGLKVLSFVEQSGHDRRRVLWLNVWYSLGLISVFMALATAAVLFRLLGKQLSWGQQFTWLSFNVGITSLVFVMALSFLGVWEIPIPGFVGSGKANDLAAKEGFVGAFLKGVLTTILATPCSGPYLGVVFAFAVAQPPLITYLTFGCIGLGMASPYLLIGAFPSLVRWLPKPGAWMDTFKQLMGFVLLGTVVWLFRVIDREYFIPSLAFLFGLWLAFWWIGRTPLYADLRARLRAWGMGTIVSAAAGFVAFGWLAPRPELIAWQPFSIARLAHESAAGKTVLLDFTALW